MCMCVQFVYKMLIIVLLFSDGIGFSLHGSTLLFTDDECMMNEDEVLCRVLDNDIIYLSL